MLEKVNTVLNSSTAFKIIGLLQKRKIKNKGFIYITDPFIPTKHLHLHNLGIMEPNQLGFGTGTWLDFYAYATNKSYLESLKEILYYIDKDDLFSNEDLQNVSAVLYANKLVTETLLRNRSNIIKSDFALKARLFIKSRSIQPEFCKNIAFCLKGKDLNYFSDLIYQFYKPVELQISYFKADEIFFCVPYFINQHLVNHIDVFSLNGKFPKFKTRLNFFNSKFSFSNLWSAPLSAMCLHIFKNYEILLSVAEKHINYGDYVGFSDVCFNPKGCFHELYSSLNGIYYPQKEEDIEKILEISPAFPLFKISSNSSFIENQPNSLIDLIEFSKKKLEAFYLEDNYYSPRISELINTIKDQELYIAEFLELAEYNKWSTLINILKAIQNNNKLFETNSYIVFKTPDGYILQQNKNSVRTDITNFIFKIHQKIMFRNDFEQYYDASFIFDKKEYNLFISHSKVRDPQKLKQEIHNIFIQSIPSNSTQVDIYIPIVFDVTVNRILTLIFFQEAKKVKTILGIDHLGFSHDKQVWNTYDGVVDINGYRRQFNFVKPTSLVLNQYFKRPKKVKNLQNVDSREGRLLICAYVCNFMRYFYQGLFVPVTIHGTYWKPLLALMSEFGQTDVIKIQRNFKGSDLEELNGIPHIITYSNDILTPCFMLHTVYNLNTVWVLPQSTSSEEKMKDMSTVFRNIMIRVVHACLNGIQSDYLTKIYDNRELEYMTYIDMAKEGAEILNLLEITKNWSIDSISPQFRNFISSLPDNSTFYTTLTKDRLNGLSVRIIESELYQNNVTFDYDTEKKTFQVKKHQLQALL